MSGLADNTIYQSLRRVDQLYHHAEEMFGPGRLDQAISNLDFADLDVALVGFFNRIVNRSDLDGAGQVKTWSTAVRFVRDCCRLLAASAVSEIDRIELNLEHLHRSYQAIRPAQKQKNAALRALPAGVLEDLYQIIGPHSQRNPFRSEDLRWRNFVLVLLMLHQGLRRGEAAILPLDVVKSGFDKARGTDRFWMTVDRNPYEKSDSRYEPPGLKTSNAIRRLPLSSSVVEAITTYQVNFRGKQNHTFLLASQKDQPLALRSINDVMGPLYNALSPGAKRELTDERFVDVIRPHDLRHTCAVVRLRQFMEEVGIGEELAHQKLRVFFGWSRTSTMPLLYARSFYEDRIHDVWDNAFDARVEQIRGSK
ncbi:MAG TPA: tyrosine-type recombinase/integrase [Dongiaceae bacterium]|nr:tyrosine-type recombinase/integrase [Dongiaceae bacterium]